MAKRAIGRSQVAQLGFKRRVWHPELVNVIHCYPKTQEAFDERVRKSREAYERRRAANDDQPVFNRRGVADGWGGKSAADCHRIREKSAEQAKIIVAALKRDGLVNTEDPRAEEALEFCIGVVRAKDENGKGAYATREALQAAGLVLKFTKSPPATKQDVTIRTAEAFLDEIAAAEGLPPADAR